MEVEKKLGMSLDALIGEAKAGQGRSSKPPHPGRTSRSRQPVAGLSGAFNGGGRGRGRANGPAGGQKRGRNDAEAVVEIRVARRIFVNNLAFSTTWQSLKDCFSAAGNVVYADVLREGTGQGARSKVRSHAGRRISPAGAATSPPPSGHTKGSAPLLSAAGGCGIVEFERPEEAAAAITHLHLTQLDGREIMVREDREDFELQDGGSHSGGRGGGGANKSRRGPGATGLADAASGPGCHNCGQVGHIARECSSADKAGGGGALWGASSGAGCFECGETGHNARDCPKKGSTNFGNSSGLQIVVHGLPYAMAWQELKDLVRAVTAAAGGSELHQARTDVVKDSSGRSRGYGTVLFDTKNDAAAAVQAISGYEHEGRVLTAKYDRLA